MINVYIGASVPRFVTRTVLYDIGLSIGIDDGEGGAFAVIPADADKEVAGFFSHIQNRKLSFPGIAEIASICPCGIAFGLHPVGLFQLIGAVQQKIGILKSQNILFGRQREGERRAREPEASVRNTVTHIYSKRIK